MTLTEGLVAAGVLGGLYFLATGKLKFGGTTQAAGSPLTRARTALPPVRSTPGSSQSFLPTQNANAGVVGGGPVDIQGSGLSFSGPVQPFQSAEFSTLGRNLVVGIGHAGGYWQRDMPRGGSFGRRNFGPHPHLSLDAIAGIGHAGGWNPRMVYNALQGAWVEGPSGSSPSPPRGMYDEGGQVY